MAKTTMKNFGESRPAEGIACWIWMDRRWRMGCLAKTMYPLHDERDRLSWDVLGGEMRRADDSDRYITAEIPDNPAQVVK